MQHHRNEAKLARMIDAHNAEIARRLAQRTERLAANARARDEVRARMERLRADMDEERLQRLSGADLSVRCSCLHLLPSSLSLRTAPGETRTELEGVGGREAWHHSF